MNFSENHNLIIVLPLLVPMLTGIICLLFWWRQKFQKGIHLVGGVLTLIASLILFYNVWENGMIVSTIGSWPVPFGIVYAADLLSATLVLLTGIVGFCVGIYALVDIDNERKKFGFFILYHFLIFGVNGAFLTGDIFNLYVWFEVMLISSFVLLALGSEKAQLEGAIKYVTINLVSSVLFLTAVGMLYGMAGSLNMADLALIVPLLEHQGLVTLIGILFIISFGIKAALFPLFFWLPASYHTPPSSVSAIFAGLLTKVGVYALLRTFSMIFIFDQDYTHEILIVLAGATMLAGIMGAFTQPDLRRLFAFLVVSHIGYLVMGIGLMTSLALTGAFFYLIHDILIKTNMFMLSGMVRRMGGSNLMSQVGGLYKARPYFALLFGVIILSLAGIPPLSGFWGKLILIKAALDEGAFGIAAVALITGFLTLYVVMKVWIDLFWKSQPVDELFKAPDEYTLLPMASKMALVTPVIILTLLSLGIGFGAEHVLALSERIASQIIDPMYYIEHVNGLSK